MATSSSQQTRNAMPSSSSKKVNPGRYRKDAISTAFEEFASGDDDLNVTDSSHLSDEKLWEIPKADKRRLFLEDNESEDAKPPSYGEVDDEFAGGDRALRVVDIFGLIHDDLWKMREQVRYLLKLHDPMYFSENPDDHIGEYEAPLCPMCGKQRMIVRQRRDGSGEFWSCLNFPACRGTMSMDKAKGIIDAAKQQRVVEATPGKTNEF